MSHHSSDSLHDPEIRNQQREATDLPLFEQAHARRSDPVHSHKAAASVVNLGRTKEKILSLFRTYGPMTDESLVAVFGKGASPSGIRTRRSWLVDHGFVVEAGEGKTVSGRSCSKWRIK